VVHILILIHLHLLRRVAQGRRKIVWWGLASSAVKAGGNYAVISC